MLSKGDRTGLLLSVLLAAPLPPRAALAAGAGDAQSIRRPDQLTVGVADEYLGQLAPDGKRIYFITDRNTLQELFFQDLDTGRALQVFDERADVTWARISPSGRNVLFISYRDDAAGQLCVGELPSGASGTGAAGESGGAAKKRRCLDDGSRAVQAQWLNDGEIILLSRTSLQGNMQLTRVLVGPRLSSRPLLEKNLASPTVSPDGRWLVYVPVERYLKQVGPGFAAQATQRLEAVRLSPDGSAAPLPPMPLHIDLPGWTGQPAFSADGKSLYFTQYFNDTNHDGVVDANDHGVLFRVPFAGGGADAPALAQKAFPDQITDSSWNCQYPTPADQLLITTCAYGENLHVYRLPLDGVVPKEWDQDRLREEIEVSSKRLDLLTLYRKLIGRETDGVQRNAELARLIALHLERDEFDAAEFYAKDLGAHEDPASAGLARVLLSQVAHRRAVRARDAGRGGAAFREAAHKRMLELPLDDAGSPASRALRRVVRSEIADSLGDKDEAKKELVAAELDQVAVPAVLEEFHVRADALYRELDDPAALWTAERRLVTLPMLAPEERLRHARAAVRALVRGLPQAEAEAALGRRKAETGAAEADSDLAFALDLSRAVMGIRDSQPPQEVEDALVALYKKQNKPERRHAVMTEAGQRAEEHDAPQIIEALVQLYIDDVPRGTRERRRAEKLYQRIMEGRGYRLLAQGKLAQARDLFGKVAKNTGSLESFVQSVDLRLRGGEKFAAIQAEYNQPGHAGPVTHFVRSYLLSLTLATLDGVQHEQTVKRAIKELLAGWEKLHGDPIASVLYGVLLHEEFLRTRRLSDGVRADVHYLVALDNLKDNPRYRALVLEQLGLLQAHVGNYRIAMGYLEDRDKLPFPDHRFSMLHKWVKAETLLHLDREADAAQAIDEALAIADGHHETHPVTAEVRLLLLDRAALYNLAAGHFERALSLYDREEPLLAARPGVPGQRTRLVVRLGRVAAALGARQPRRALADLALVDGKLSEAALSRPLRDGLQWPHTSGTETVRSYRIIAAGLRAEVGRAAGQLDEATQALQVRRTLLKARYDDTKVDDLLRPLSLTEAQLADVARQRHDDSTAGKWLTQALGHADTFVKNSHVTLGGDALALLWIAAELRLTATSDPALRVDLPRRMRAALAALAAPDSDASLKGYQRLFEIYLPMMSALGGPAQ